MSSTQTPPQTHLNGGAAIEKLKEISEKAQICMFCTQLDQLPIKARPMYLQETDAAGNMWFISGEDSRKNTEVRQDERVQLFFMNNDKSEYLSVFGTTSVHTDRSTIDDKWSVFANAWFDGKEDPNVSILCVTPVEAYYWDTKAGKLVSMLHFISAIVTGGNSDNRDGVEGELRIS